LDKLKHKIVSFSVGKAAKLKVDNEKDILTLPGPDKYTYISHTFDSKNGIFSKDKRSSLGMDNHLPGPGAYNAKHDNAQPNFSIPRSNTSWIKSSSTPGPGTYEHTIKEANDYNSIRINIDQRKPFYNEKKGIPGPGSYDSPTERHASHGFK
jgi:Sperm-tail PG-rich repeat